MRETQPGEGRSLPCFELALLDGFDLLRDGDHLLLPLSAQRLVAFLALRRRPVPRLVAGVGLWGDASEHRAAAALRTALWRIGQAGGTLVEVHGSSLALADRVVVDVRETARAAHRALRGSAEGTELDLLLGAGEVLPDWYEDWILLERERLRVLRLEALEALATRALDDRRYGEALEAALSVIGAEPLRESALSIAVRVHLAQGNVVEARRRYELYRTLLRRQLGVEPSGAMAGLLA